VELTFTLNGEVKDAAIDEATLLLDLLRDIGLTGTKEGCAVGVCGACTVLVDELPIASCITLAAAVAGREVWTVEGLTARDDQLLEAFVEQEGMQCGICTPGQVVSTFALGLANPRATEEEIRAYMAGNLCRCTGYVTIVASVRAYLEGR
jgi:aerobic-type carbon monoxide dehydrogenase small subunit (CoxS/CutS family)